jgi:2-oxoglutarate/2-oxoacid ferredoxin oxidoreductase subunit beta
VNLQLMMFNNRVYGLTKGQYSPTSLVGHRSPSTPMGSLDMPVNPALFALGSNARFVARGIDTVVKSLGGLFFRAREHEGASFLEILQNCPVFNDGEWENVTAREVASDMQLWVEHGQPMLFGKEKNKGLRLAEGGQVVEVVTVGEGGITVDDIAVHDERNRTLAFLLAQLMPPVFPMVFGVLYCDPGASYDGAVVSQNQAAVSHHGAGSIDALLRQGHTWTVE